MKRIVDSLVSCLGRFSIVALTLFLAVGVRAQTVFSIQGALASARNNNPFLKTEHFNINVAQSDIITAKLRPNPSLNNQTLQLANSKYYPSGSEWHNAVNRQVWWQLTRPFQLPSLRRSKIDFATRASNLALQGYDETVRKFSFDVANQWLLTWIIESRLDLLQQAYTNLDSLVKINRARLRNQVITQTDLMRTQLLLEQYNLQLISAKKDFRNEIQQLKFLIGSADSIDVDIKAPIESVLLPSSVDTLYNQALSNRTDIQTAKSNILVAESNIRLQKAFVLPTPELGVIWNPQNTVPYVGFFGTIKLPILDRNQGEREKSKYLQLQAVQNLQATEMQLRTEVTAAFQAYQTEKENLKKYENILTQSQLVLDNVKYSYLRGGTTIIDFLDAQRSWFDTRQLYLNQMLSYHQSYIRLLFVTGLINQM
ncbi:MAG TPA: TolC family protein [Cyclobacteriaceae bacterium]|jgi:cobalt-zinc-cadmium efflux system outer membrane protein|nr:TolC family protein [Cyclobacteriaceae bacterium]